MHASTPFAIATPPPAFSPPPGASPASYRPSPASRASLSLHHAPNPTSSARSHRAPSIMSTSRTSGLASGLDDPVIEARKVVALLNGVAGAQPGTGLLARLESDCQAVFDMYDEAWEEGAEPDTSALETMLSTMQQLVKTLQSSSVGGFPIASPASTDAAATNLATRIEQTSNGVRDLFKERSRVKEGAEIAGSVLSG